MTAIAVDASGNVFVTGGSSPGGGENRDYATMKYSGAGVPLWTNHYDGPGQGADAPQGKASLAVGPDGAVHVTDASDGASPVAIFFPDVVTFPGSAAFTCRCWNWTTAFC